MSEFGAIKYTGKGHEGMTDKNVHINGGFIAGAETLCGNVDTLMPSVETDEPVTCVACIEIYQGCRKAKGIKLAKKADRN